jgi:flagellar hook-length control protein FliK
VAAPAPPDEAAEETAPAATGFALAAPATPPQAAAPAATNATVAAPAARVRPRAGAAEAPAPTTTDRPGTGRGTTVAPSAATVGAAGSPRSPARPALEATERTGPAGDAARAVETAATTRPTARGDASAAQPHAHSAAPTRAEPWRAAVTSSAVAKESAAPPGAVRTGTRTPTTPTSAEGAPSMDTLPAGAASTLDPGAALSANARQAVDPAGLVRGDALTGAFKEAPVEEMPARIVRTAEAGGRQLQVRLHPAELGRLDIRLDFDGERGLRVHIRADNDQALDLLQRQGHQLERALQQSGFDVGRDAIRYDLDQGGGRFGRGGAGGEGAQPDGRHGRTPADGAGESAGGDGTAPDRPPEPAHGVEIRNVLDLHV